MGQAKVRYLLVTEEFVTISEASSALKHFKKMLVKKMLDNDKDKNAVKVLKQNSHGEIIRIL